MDFRKKLKIRLFIAIGYIVLGIAMITTFNIIKAENDFLSSFGFALTVVGIVNIRNYIKITKNEETIMKRQIAETDERNISIANRAKSISFITYVLLASIAVIILELLNKIQLAMILSGTVGVLVLIYWVSYWIINKKS